MDGGRGSMVVSTARLRALSRKWAPLLLWLVVAVLAMVGLGQAINWSEVQAAFQKADVGWLVVAGGTIGATQFLKAVRWRFLLQAHGIRPPLVELVRVQLIGQGLNTFLPLRIGEVARIQWLQRYDRVLVLSTITIEKSADLLCFGAMGIALAVGTTLPDWLTDRFRTFAITTMVMMGMLLLLLAVSREGWLTPLLDKVPFFRPFLTPYLRFREGWRQVTRPRDGLVLMGLSGAIWLMAIATNLAMLAAFTLPADWIAGTALLVILQIGITVVTLPATLGIFEYLCVVTLGWFGVSYSVAFGIGIALHLLVLIPSVAGILFALPHGNERE